MLNQITPVILTYNEEANIDRCLKHLQWAKDVVVVDSFSDDNTLNIISRYKNTRVFQRKFDAHANQWNFAIASTGISTDWVLSLDADYMVPEYLVDEINAIAMNKDTVGYEASFTYCVNGHALRGALYPPVKVLFRKDKGIYVQDGHTQRLELDGECGALKNQISHDDRKSFSRWLSGQKKYMRLEASHLDGCGFRELKIQDRLRKMIVFAPPVVFIYCLIIKGLILDRIPGLYYSFQRAYAEAILSFYLLKNMFRLRP